MPYTLIYLGSIVTYDKSNAFFFYGLNKSSESSPNHKKCKRYSMSNPQKNVADIPHFEKLFYGTTKNLTHTAKVQNIRSAISERKKKRKRACCVKGSTLFCKRKAAKALCYTVPYYNAGSGKITQSNLSVLHYHVLKKSPLAPT